MRVLTATSTTQGDRGGDICHTTDGELVTLPVLECACPDCGCVRHFAGLEPGLDDGPDDGLALDREVVDDVLARMRVVAEAFPSGTVLGRVDGAVVVRRAPAP